MSTDTTADNFFGFDASMKIPLISSGVFHIVLFLLTVIGLPYIAKEPLIVNTPISIELVTAEKTQTPEPAKPKPSPPSPPQMAKEAPPDLTEPIPEPEKPKEKPKETVEPEPVPNPDLKPEPVKKIEKKPKPDVTKVEKKPEPKKDFASLLKNLTPDVDEKPKPETQVENKTLENESETPITELGDQLTRSETDAVLYQLSQCWNVLSGAKMAEDLVIQVRLTINPDRTVNNTSIVDQGRYNRDPSFKAAADAALRALKNPKCSPLALPPEKYDLWKNTVINFDPREML